MTFSYWILSTFIAYFAILIVIAVLQSRQMQSMSDYVLGGRGMSSFTSALSAGSSSTSGWTMLVFPALAFSQGAIQLWTVLGIVVGLWLNWVVLAKRLRRYTIAADDSLTLPEFFEKRFDDKTGTLRTISGLITIFFVIFYVTSGLIAGAKLLETVFGLEYNAGIVIALIAVASYTFIGGFLAVSKTDVFQALIMLGSFMILPLFLIVMTDAPFQAGGATSSGFWNPLTDVTDSPVTIFFFLSVIGWGLGGFGSQRVLQRFMAVESEERIPASRDIGVAWTALIFCFGLLLGLVGLPALAEVGMLEEAMQDPERVYLLLSEAFFHPVVAGLLLTGVIAAVMSTADSQLLLASAIATDDLPIIKRYTYSIGAHARVWLGRFLLVVVGFIAAVLAVVSPDSVLHLVSYAWGGMGAAFGPAIILALYWRRFNFWGALTSIVIGSVVASVWWSSSEGTGGLWDIEPATPGFIIAMPLAAVVTLLTPKPSEEVVGLFDQVNPPKAALSPSGAD